MSAIWPATALSQPIFVFRPVPTAVPPWGAQGGAQDDDVTNDGQWPSFRGYRARGIAEGWEMPGEWDVAAGENVALMRTETKTALDNRQVRLQIAEARLKGYEGDACGSCGAFTLVRNGTCLKCVSCGATSGCS